MSIIFHTRSIAFSHKEMLANALIERNLEALDMAFKKIDNHIPSISIGGLTKALLAQLLQFNEDSAAIHKLMEAGNI